LTGEKKPPATRGGGPKKGKGSQESHAGKRETFKRRAAEKNKEKGYRGGLKAGGRVSSGKKKKKGSC